LTTLAALISGIVASKNTQLPKVAAKVPNGTKPESRAKRFARWLDNERILEEVYFLPYAELWSCTGPLRIIISPPKLGKMPPTQETIPRFAYAFKDLKIKALLVCRLQIRKNKNEYFQRVMEILSE
jgi:hypothetical protein